MIDYICAIKQSVLHKGLRKLNLVDATGGLDLGLPIITTDSFTEDGHSFYFAIIRCVESDEKNRVESLAEIPAIEILGHVEDGFFVWKDEVSQDCYERHLEVGKHRKYVPAKDANGNYIVNENMELVKIKSTHPYRFGSFC